MVQNTVDTPAQQCLHCATKRVVHLQVKRFTLEQSVATGTAASTAEGDPRLPLQIFCQRTTRDPEMKVFAFPPAHTKNFYGSITAHSFFIILRWFVASVLTIVRAVNDDERTCESNQHDLHNWDNFGTEGREMRFRDRLCSVEAIFC